MNLLKVIVGGVVGIGGIIAASIGGYNIGEGLFEEEEEETEENNSEE